MNKPVSCILTALLLAVEFTSVAQVNFCTSNALKPVFKQDFGQAATPTTTSKAKPGSTTYIYGGVQNDGHYIITPRVDNANKADWTKGGDHTGNVNGNMFLVNTGGGNKVYFRDTAYNLCQGSIFNFTAWIANVNTDKTKDPGVCGQGVVYPRVIFNIRDINGNLLNSDTTKQLPLSPNNGPPNWNQYGFQFSLPVGITSVIFEMVDFFGGFNQCGNDVALDDILFTACTPQITAKISTNTSACMGKPDTISSSLINSPYTNPAYQWQKSTDGGNTWINVGKGSTTAKDYILQSASFSDNGLYRVLVGPDSASLYSQTCTAASNSVPFIVNPVPTVTAFSNGIVCSNTTLSLTANAISGTAPYAFKWFGPNAFVASIANPIKNNTALQDSGYYTVVASDANGCNDTATTKVTITLTPSLQIKNTTDTICSNTKTNIQLVSSLSNSSFIYTSAIINGAVFGNSNKTIPDTTSFIQDSLINTSATIATVRYIITAINNNLCNSNSDTITIFIQPTASKANAGINQKLCNANTVLLTGNTPQIGSGIWSILGSNTASINNPTLSATTVSGLLPNKIYSFIWKITAAKNCPSFSDTIQIINRPSITKADAGKDTFICNFINTTQIQLQANLDTSRSFEKGSWQMLQQPGGATINNIFAPNAIVSVNQLGQYVLQWTLTNDNNCTPSSNTIVITVYNQPIAGNIITNASPACALSNAVFSASNIVGSIFKWQYKSNSLTNNLWKDTITNSNTLLFSAVLDTLKARLIVQSTSNLCAVFDTSNVAVVAINPTTVAGNLVGDSSVCLSSNSGTIHVKNYIGNIVKWEQSTDSIHWTSIANITDSLNYHQLTTTTYYRAFVQSGVCAGLYTNTVTIKVLAPPIKAIAGINRIICLQDSIQLQANNAVNGIGTWNLVSGNAATINNIHSPTTAVNNLIAGKYTFSWTISNNVCAASSDTINVIMNNPAKALFNVTTNAICDGTFIDSNFVRLIKSNDNQLYEWYLNDSLISKNNFFPSIIIHAANSATIKLKAISAYGCTNDSISKNITVLHAPTTKFSINDSIGCAPFTIQFTNTTANINGYTYYWNFGNGFILNQPQPNPVQYLGSHSGLDTSYVIQLTAMNTCDTISTNKKIIVKEKAHINFSALPNIGCSPLTVLFNNNSVGDSATYIFTDGIGKDSVISAVTSFNRTYHAGSNQIFNASIIAKNSCGLDTLQIPISIQPNPTIVNIEPIDSLICGNVIVFINKTINATRFVWNFGDGNSITTNTLNDTIKHSYGALGTYTVSIQISNNCSDTIIFRTVHTYKPPVAAFTLNNQVCIGDTVHFINQSNTQDYTLWKFGNNRSSNNFNTATIYTTSGLYNAWLITGKKYGNFFCYDSTTLPVQIVAQQKGKLIGDTLGKCIPFNAHFYNTTPIAITNTSWNFSDGTNSTGDSIVHSFIKAGTYTITMQSTSISGCTYLDSSIIKVIAPQTNINATTNAGCVNTTLTFRMNTTNTDSVIWNFGDGNIIIDNNTTVHHAYNKPGIYKVITTIKNNTGCSLIIPVQDSLKIDNVKANFSIQSTYNCGNTNFNFKDSSNSFFGITDYFWKTSTGSTSNQKQIQQNFTADVLHKVALLVKSKYGCTDSASASIPVIVHQLPQASINGIADACKAALVNFESKIISRDSIFYRLWNLGNGTTSKDSIVKVTYYNAGSYGVKLTVATINRCIDSAFKLLAIHSEPVVGISPPQKICRGDSILLQANGASGYIWKDQSNNIICNICNNVVVKPANNSIYNVVGYNQWGCSNIASTNINVIQPFKLQASPNDTICIGTPIRIFANGAATYQWYPTIGLSNPSNAVTTAQPLVTTTYHVIGKDNAGCFTDSSTITITVGIPTPMNIGKDTILLAGTQYQFKAIAARNDVKKWNWQGANFSCTNCATPTAKIIDDVCINCTVTNIFGCISSDTICIKTFCPQSEVFVPNAFTPDGDGINDKLIIQGRGIKIVKSFRVFNRWGEMVFERTNFAPGDPSYGWDGTVRGKAASPDVYVYVAEVICEKGYLAIFKGNTAILK